MAHGLLPGHHSPHWFGYAGWGSGLSSLFQLLLSVTLGTEWQGGTGAREGSELPVRWAVLVARSRVGLHAGRRESKLPVPLAGGPQKGHPTVYSLGVCGPWDLQLPPPPKSWRALISTKRCFRETSETPLLNWPALVLPLSR